MLKIECDKVKLVPMLKLFQWFFPLNPCKNTLLIWLQFVYGISHALNRNRHILDSTSHTFHFVRWYVYPFLFFAAQVNIKHRANGSRKSWNWICDKIYIQKTKAYVKLTFSPPFLNQVFGKCEHTKHPMHRSKIGAQELQQ